MEIPGEDMVAYRFDDDSHYHYHGDCAGHALDNHQGSLTRDNYITEEEYENMGHLFCHKCGREILG